MQQLIIKKIDIPKKVDLVIHKDENFQVQKTKKYCNRTKNAWLYKASLFAKTWLNEATNYKEIEIPK